MKESDYFSKIDEQNKLRRQNRAALATSWNSYADISIYGSCKKCKSTNITYTTKQLRSPDEASSVIYTCKSCNHQWRVG